MKIIFLDIDGVLNNRESIMKGVEIIPEKVLLIEDICARTDARIVISSAWRILHPISELVFALNCSGLSNRRVIGITPRSESGHRGSEIKRRIDDGSEDVEAFVIIDDDSDMLPEQMDYFIQTDMMHGLTREEADEAIGILGEREK